MSNNFDEKIKPFFFVEHEDTASLCLNVGEYKAEIFEEREDEGFEGSGYDWQSLALVFLNEKVPELKDAIGTKIEYVGYEDISIDGMTIHKAKGLASDQVIIIGLDPSFPNNNIFFFWLEYLFRSKPQKEKIPFAEERRLFYVALTRTKNYVYLLVNENPNLRSPFINEIYGIIKENN